MSVVAEYHPLITCSISFVSCFCVYVHRVSKNVPPMACYNFDMHIWTDFDIFGRNVTAKVGNQKML